MKTRFQFKKFLLTTFLFNMGSSLLKSVALSIFFSPSLLADTIHSWMNTISQGLLRLGIGRGPLPRSRENPFGFSGRFYFFSYIATIILLSAAAFNAIAKGIVDMRRPQTPSFFPGWLVALFLSSFLLIAAAILILYRFLTRIRGADTLLSFLKKSKRVDLVVIFLQQISLLSTSLFVFVSLILSQSETWMPSEGAGSIVIGIIMLANALLTGMKMQDLLIGESAELSISKRIYSVLVGEEWIVEIDSLQTLQLEDESILLVIKAECQDHLKANEVNILINGLEQDLRRDYPAIKHLFFESAQQTIRL